MEANKTKHEVINICDIETKLVVRNFGFIPEQIPRLLIGIETNNVAMDINDAFKYLKEIHTKVANFKCSNYKGACVPVPSGLVIPA